MTTELSTTAIRRCIANELSYGDRGECVMADNELQALVDALETTNGLHGISQEKLRQMIEYYEDMRAERDNLLITIADLKRQLEEINEQE